MAHTGMARDASASVPPKIVPAEGWYRNGYPVVAKVTAGLSIVEGIAQAGPTTGDSEGWPAVSVIINEVTIK